MKKVQFKIYSLMSVACIAMILYINLNSNDGKNNTQEEETKYNTETIVQVEIESQTSGEVQEIQEVDSDANTLEESVMEVVNNSENYPPELVELVQRNPLTIQFVLDYGNHKTYDIDISKEINTGKIPLFIQWDERWGYEYYGDAMIGINGCGPTCMSMVAAYLLKQDYMNPLWMAKYSQENGYVSRNGTLWKFMSEGAQKLGINASTIPLDKEKIIDNLENGHPIILSMGPGVFTTEGHFIVLCGYENGKFTINDPNNPINSAKQWNYEEFSNQIKNIWVYSIS